MKRVKTPVRIRFKEIANGVKSIYLDIYKDGIRTYEFLKLYINPGRDPATKAANDNAMTAAVAIQAQRIQEITNNKAGIKAVTGKKKLIDVVDELAIERANANKQMTYADTLRLHIATFKHGNIDIKSIDKDWCLKFQNYLITAKKNGEAAYKPHTIKTIMAAMSAVLTYATGKGYIASNPIRQFTATEKYNKSSAERCYLTIEELQRFMSVYTKHVESRRAFIFSAYSGLRISDIETLTWADIIERDGSVIIQKRFIKPDKYAEIPLGRQALLFLGQRQADDQKVFNVPARSSINQHIQKIAEEAGIKKHVTFHMARHTFATMALTAGVDIYTLSELLIHSSIQTTQIYAKIVDSKKKTAIDLLDKLIEK